MSQSDNFTDFLLSGYFSPEYNVPVQTVAPLTATLELLQVAFESQPAPQLYKMLLALLYDYNPHLGHDHRKKVSRYIHILLEPHPELADYLVSLLPWCKDDPPPDYSQTVKFRAGSKRPAESDAPNVQQSSQTTDKSSPLVSFYNYTPPAVRAFVRSQGVPTKVTKVIQGTDHQTKADHSSFGFQGQVKTVTSNASTSSEGGNDSTASNCTSDPEVGSEDNSLGSHGFPKLVIITEDKNVTNDSDTTREMPKIDQQQGCEDRKRKVVLHKLQQPEQVEEGSDMTNVRPTSLHNDKHRQQQRDSRRLIEKVSHPLYHYGPRSSLYSHSFPYYQEVTTLDGNVHQFRISAGESTAPPTQLQLMMRQMPSSPRSLRAAADIARYNSLQTQQVISKNQPCSVVSVDNDPYLKRERINSPLRDAGSPSIKKERTIPRIIRRVPTFRPLDPRSVEQGPLNLCTRPSELLRHEERMHDKEVRKQSAPAQAKPLPEMNKYPFQAFSKMATDWARYGLNAPANPGILCNVTSQTPLVDVVTKVEPDSSDVSNSPSNPPEPASMSPGFEVPGYYSRLTSHPSPPNYNHNWRPRRGQRKRKKKVKE